MRALVTHTVHVPPWVREMDMGFGLYALSDFPPPSCSQIEKRIRSAPTVNPATFYSKISDGSFNLLRCSLACLRVTLGDSINSQCSPSCLPLPHASFQILTVRSQYFHPPLDLSVLSASEHSSLRSNLSYIGLLDFGEGYCFTPSWPNLSFSSPLGCTETSSHPSLSSTT